MMLSLSTFMPTRSWMEIKKITLGLIWTILHHFQLNKELSPVSELDPQAQPADVLLAWARKVTFSYVLTIIDFGSSWIDGKVFCAILIQSGFLQDYDWAEICQMSVESRLRVAFETAELRLK